MHVRYAWPRPASLEPLAEAGAPSQGGLDHQRAAEVRLHGGRDRPADAQARSAGRSECLLNNKPQARPRIVNLRSLLWYGEKMGAPVSAGTQQGLQGDLHPEAQHVVPANSEQSGVARRRIPCFIVVPGRRRLSGCVPLLDTAIAAHGATIAHCQLTAVLHIQARADGVVR